MTIVDVEANPEDGNIRVENSDTEESLVDKIEKILLERFDKGEGDENKNRSPG